MLVYKKQHCSIHNITHKSLGAALHVRGHGRNSLSIQPSHAAFQYSPSLQPFDAARLYDSFNAALVCDSFYTALQLRGRRTAPLKSMVKALAAEAALQVRGLAVDCNTIHVHS